MTSSHLVRTRARRPLLCALALLACGAAQAALDGPPGDGPTQRPGSAGTPANTAFTEIARTLPSGTEVHEYADASGTVFALSWSGPYKPDLKQLLGPRFGAFTKAAAKERRATRSRLDVDADDLVVRSGGHMGAFTGRAWIPSRLPAGFDPHEMK